MQSDSCGTMTSVGSAKHAGKGVKGAARGLSTDCWGPTQRFKRGSDFPVLKPGQDFRRSHEQRGMQQYMQM